MNGSALPSTMTTSSPLSRWTTTRGSRAIAFPFRDCGLQLNTSAPFRHSAQTGDACGPFVATQ